MQVLGMPDHEKFFNSGSGCAQWLEEPDGSLLIPIYFKNRAKSEKNGYETTYSSTVMQCQLDGKTLRYVRHGTELEHPVPRGCYEPSLTKYQEQYFLTLRNDEKAFFSTSLDGLHYGQTQPWTFEDGEELGSYNTQQHWVTHSKGLFLAYTRRGADNDHIPRNRAPLFISRVNTEKMTLIRASEKILVPERGAMLGNFGVVTVNSNESWVTVGEGMYSPKAAERGADGRVYAARIRWNSPNAIAPKLENQE